MMIMMLWRISLLQFRAVFLLCTVISILTTWRAIGEQSRQIILLDSNSGMINNNRHVQSAVMLFATTRTSTSTTTRTSTPVVTADSSSSSASSSFVRSNHQTINASSSTGTDNNIAGQQQQQQQQEQPPHQYEICFVTSVFAADLVSADTVGNVTEHRRSNPTFEYLLFTNRDDIEAPGWTRILVLSNKYQRLITQSRLAKFVPWQVQHPQIAAEKKCRIIFYMDGYTLPIHSPRAVSLFRQAATLIRNHKFGLGQYPKRGSRIQRLAKGLVQEGKDTASNINTTMTWLQSQPDFRSSCTVYLNRHFGLDPNNENYRKLASYFWDLYSQENGSWRDQLLWCYVVDKFQANPVNLYREVGPMKHLFEERREGMGYNGHKYVLLQEEEEKHQEQPVVTVVEEE